MAITLGFRLPDILTIGVASAKLSERMRKLSRLALAIGGFLIMTGMILTGTFFLALLSLIDVGVFVGEIHLLLLTLILLLIGTLDIVAGIILLRK
jgi:hypothetical protein